MMKTIILCIDVRVNWWMVTHSVYNELEGIDEDEYLVCRY